MKRLLAFFLVCLSLFSLYACATKSKAAEKADRLIEAIGEVTLDSEEAIKKAESAVAALEEKEQSTLDGLETLEQARKTYNELVDAKKVSDVEAAINAVGTVTLDSSDAINAAQKAYDELESRLQGSVSNLKVLEDAKDAYLVAQAVVVENVIDSIGIVSLKSGDKIKTAREAYDAAAADVQAKVSNLDKLITAEDTYFAAQVAAVEKEIDAIGTVTLESGDAINSARNAYNAASADVQAKVSNLDKLTAAEEQIVTLRIQNVESLIDAIGTVTADSGDAITAAQEALAALPYEEAEMVPNRGALETAASDYEERVKERALSMLNSFIKHEDKFNGCSFYYPSGWNFLSNGKWIADKRCFILPYLGMNESYVWGRMIFNYTAGDWVFWENVIVLADDQKFTYTYSYFDITRDNAGGKVWEYYDVDADMDMLKAIAASNEAVVRFEGDEYRHDFTISAADKKAIQDFLDVYYALVDSGAYKPY